MPATSAADETLHPQATQFQSQGLFSGVSDDGIEPQHTTPPEHRDAEEIYAGACAKLKELEARVQAGRTRGTSEAVNESSMPQRDIESEEIPASDYGDHAVPATTSTTPPLQCDRCGQKERPGRHTTHIYSVVGALTEGIEEGLLCHRCIARIPASTHTDRVTIRICGMTPASTVRDVLSFFVRFQADEHIASHAVINSISRSPDGQFLIQMINLEQALTARQKLLAPCDEYALTLYVHDLDGTCLSPTALEDLTATLDHTVTCHARLLLHGTPSDAHVHDILVFFAQYEAIEYILEDSDACRAVIRTDGLPSCQFTVRMRDDDSAAEARRRLHRRYLGEHPIEVIAFNTTGTVIPTPPVSCMTAPKLNFKRVLLSLAGAQGAALLGLCFTGWAEVMRKTRQENKPA